MKKIVFLIVFCVLSYTLIAQVSHWYTFSSSTGTYSTITGTSVPSALGDDVITEPINIGFTFNYGSNSYTQIKISSNGYVTLGTTPGSTLGNDLESSAYCPVLAPLWDDTYLSGSAQYLLTNAAPNRIFIIQYTSVKWPYNSTSYINYQIRLWETGRIDYSYGSYSGTPTGSASIGINMLPGGSGNFLSITPGTPATASATIENSSISTFPGNGVIYTFLYTGNTTHVHPIGGESLPGAPGQNPTYPINWAISSANVVNAHHVTLHYSTDGGTTYPNLIADNEPNDSTYTWTVPNISTNTARVRMQVKNSSNAVIDQCASLGNFTIDTIPPTGSITLVSPANGTWVSSTPYFDWSASGLTDVTNFAVLVDGVYLAQGIPTSNTYYQCPSTITISSGWHTWTIRGLDAAGNWVQASQSWSIRVDADAPAPFLLNSPVENVWLSTKSPTFFWNASMDNGSGLAKYQIYMNNELVKDNIAPTTTQWSAFSGGFSDNTEAGISNWNTTGSWGLTTSNPHSGNYCITDSPIGNYSNNNSSSITLAQPITLQGASNMLLTFWYRSQYTWSNADHTYLEISNNGTSWTRIADYTDSSETLTWTQATHNLGAYVSWVQIYIRFKMATDGANTEDGFYFDDLVLTANGIELGDGNYQWMVKAVDNVGNIQPSSETRTLHIDTTAPHGVSGTFANLTPANNVWSADSLITFTWTPCIDDGVGFNHYELWIDGTIYKDSLAVAQYQLRPSQVLANGNHNWYVKAIDSLGNVASSAQFVLKIDRVAPADFTLLTPINNSYFIMPTPTFAWNTTTDAGCGFSHYELWIDGALNVDNLTQATSTPAMGLSEGSHPWKVFAVDNLGNRKQSTALWTTIGDWNPPTQPVLVSPINNQVVSVSRPMMTWQKSTDAGTGVHHYLLYINQLAPVPVTPADINAPIVSYQAPTALANGNHSWYVKAFDNAGGESSSPIAPFIVDVDTTPPTSIITNPIANQYIGGDSYLVSGTASDNTGGSGVQKVEISFDGGNNWLLTTHNSRYDTRGESQISTPNLTVEKSIQLLRAGNKDSLLASTGSTRSRYGDRDVYNWQYNWTGYQTGSVTIKTRATDMNNNVEAPPFALPVIVEKIAPVIQSLSANPNYAKAGTVTFSMVFQTGAHCNGMNNSVTPTVTITPAGGTARAVTQTNYQGNTWTGQTTIAQSDLNGTAVISVSNAKDNINNQMLPNATHTFVIDTAAPTAFNLISPPTGAWLNVNRPQLTWGASTDVTSGLDHYALEIDGSTSSPGNSSISSTLNTDQPAAALTMGMHNWRIIAYDRAGNSTWSSATFSFGLDLTPPVSAIAAPTNNSTIGGLFYTIAGTSSDGTGSSSSGVGSVQIKINNGNWLNTVNTGTNFNTWTYAWTGYTSGTYTLQSRATDSAGNIETSPLTTTVTVNLNPPTVQSITVTPNPAKAGTVTCNALFAVNSGGLNNSIHPTIWFTTPNATVVNFTETSFSGNSWVGTAPVTSTAQNGTATVHVTGITDNYNNTMAPNNTAGTFVIDTVAPVVSSITVNPQITNVRTDLGVQVNFTEITAGLNSNISPVVTIIPLGASASGYISVTQTGYNASTRVWSGVATITATTPEGLAAIKVTSAADLAGNVMQLTTLQNQFTIDRSAPTAFNILQPVEGSWTANRQPVISWSPSSDAISGLSGYKLFINNNQVGSDILPAVTTATVQTSLPDAEYSVRVKAFDNAQVSNERLSGTAPTLFHVDGSAPTSLISTPVNGYIVNGNSVTITGTAVDGIGAYAGIGVKYVYLSKNGGGVWDTVYTAASQVQGSVNWNWNYTGLTPGNYTISVKAVDWLDNMELPTSSISISITGTVATPTFTPVAGTYTTAQSVTIACATVGAQIRYTTDGADPTATSTLYSAALNVAANTTIKAKGFKTDWTPSAIATAAYVITGTVATPTFTPVAGTYTTAQSVTIACATAGAQIYYTTDGTDPAATSTLYSAAINVAANTTIKAKGFKTEWAPSAIATAAYVITGTVATPTFTPVAGTYTTAQNVAIACATVGAQIRYTTDGTDPTATSTLYSAALNVAATTTVKAKGFLTDWAPSATATAAYVITGIVATPTFTPVAGTYTSAQSVTIACATAGAQIYYTTDGTEPSATSTLYSAAINVAANTTIKAKGFKTDWTPSAIATAAYVITGTVATPTFTPFAGTYTTAQNVAIACATVGAQIRYTTDGNDPTAISTLYSAALNVAATTTVKAKGFLTDWALSATATAAYVITGTVATPTFTPVAGIYTTAQNVTIACTTAGAQIRYTTDGTDPTATSTLYSVAINVAATTTVKAKGFLTDWALSATATAAYVITGTVATPTFTPVAGTYTTAQSVTIACATVGAQIRYTTDGTDPTATSTLYSAALNVAATTTVKAKGFLTDWAPSATATAAYVITGTVATPTFTPVAGTYTTAQSVTIACATVGAQIRYTTDGTDPAATSTLYSAAINVAATTTIKAKAFKTDWIPSAIATAAYVITGTVATPTFTPVAGTYTSAQSVTIACATAGAQIRYTTDGTDPTATSTLYSAAINVAATTTVKAKGYLADWTPSATATAAYVITGTVATPTFTPVAGTYTTAQSVTIACVTAGAQIRYTTDGIEPTATSTLYSVAINVAANTTIKTKGFITDWTPSATAIAAYVITGTVATPTFTPAPGNYQISVDVSLACTIAGSSIRYTLDGTDPTATSALYSQPIHLIQTTTIKAKGFKTDWANSATASGLYDVAVANPEDPNVPVVTSLQGNYPNPFNPTTTIGYTIKEPCNLSIDVYNVRGNLIKQLVKTRSASGVFTTTWNGTDNSGSPVSSGIYYVFMKADSYQTCKKMILMK